MHHIIFLLLFGGIIERPKDNRWFILQKGDQKCKPTISINGVITTKLQEKAGIQSKETKNCFIPKNSLILNRF
jgi:hypothetical protein